jgi:hypothetical protein
MRREEVTDPGDLGLLDPGLPAFPPGSLDSLDTGALWRNLFPMASFNLSKSVTHLWRISKKNESTRSPSAFPVTPT